MFSRRIRRAIGGLPGCRRCRARAPRCSHPSSIASTWRCEDGEASRRRSGFSVRRHEDVEARLVRAVPHQQVSTTTGASAAIRGMGRTGYLLTLSAFGWPLLVGGVIKGVSDTLLLGKVQKVRPPEEDF